MEFRFINKLEEIKKVKMQNKEVSGDVRSRCENRSIEGKKKLLL